MTDVKIILTLYSKVECHLCHQMLESLTIWQRRFNFKIEIINIDQNPKLAKRFADRIPVLAVNDIELCQYHLDEKALIHFFENGI